MGRNMKNASAKLRWRRSSRSNEDRGACLAKDDASISTAEASETNSVKNSRAEVQPILGGPDFTHLEAKVFHGTSFLAHELRHILIDARLFAWQFHPVLCLETLQPREA